MFKESKTSSNSVQKGIEISDIELISYEHWFKSRNLRPMEYQKDILLHKLDEKLYNSKFPSVLAACPSSGKTIMSIFSIERILKKNSKFRVLVLTHGTTVLRSQYFAELQKIDPDFSFAILEEEDYSQKSGKKATNKEILYDKNNQVIVTLPHTISRMRELPPFDLLIVDEAHHFYFATSSGDSSGMVQKIIDKIKRPRKKLYQLLLTGTPSKFIKRNYPIIPVTINELVKYDMVADLFVELASSTYNFTNEDYNSEEELKTTVKFRQQDTNSTLDMLLNQLTERLKSVLRDYPEAYYGLQHTLVKKSVKWISTLKTLEKTMIACKTQEQARQVARYFENQNINVALSTSDDDIDAEEIQRFKIDKKCLVLIVVARGVLGLNYPELENVIDMTGSRDIDRIFQLMCRVVRPHPKNRKKFFIKISPNHMEQYMHHLMTAVLCMCDESFYLTYAGGKTLGEMSIPYQRNKSKDKGGDKNQTRKERARDEMTPVNFAGVPAVQLLTDILHKNHGAYNPYAYSKIKEIRNVFLSESDRTVWTKETIIATITG